MKNKLSFFITILLFSTACQIAWACGTSGCSLARAGSEGKLSEPEERVFTHFGFEQKIWQKRDVALAHELHHQGHHVHVKTHEEFYHFGLGANPAERLSLFAEIPFIVRHSIETDSHAYLGKRQRSEGFGDLTLTGIFKPFKAGNYFLGPMAGIKLPTGVTTEKNLQGSKFEAELQPGSGSFDPSMGAAFEYAVSRVGLHGNALYTIRTPGAHEFEFGNLFSTYVYADYHLNPDSKYMQTKIGLDAVLHNEQKQKHHKIRIADSGGTTFYLGPQLAIEGTKRVSIYGNILFPVYQNLGGVHQLVRFIWNAGVKIAF